VIVNMAKKRGKAPMELHQIAHYAFFVGLLVAIVASFFRTYIGPEVLVTTLVFLGLIVGLFNLTAKETTPFLLAAVALMLAGIVNLSLIPFIGTWLRQALSNIVVFVVPGAIIVGLKTIWKLASN
jgi:prepilin signal peptidase PulO-like enzyme (type II secretory pathway)